VVFQVSDAVGAMSAGNLAIEGIPDCAVAVTADDDAGYRVAERIATLDVLSNGRVEFGSGEGSAAAELDAFGVPPGDKRAMWEEGLRVALRCLTESPFTGHAGDHAAAVPADVRRHRRRPARRALGEAQAPAFGQ